MLRSRLVLLIRRLEDLDHLRFVVFSRALDALTEKQSQLLKGCKMVQAKFRT